MESMNKPKSKSASFAIWDLLPIFPLAVILVVHLALLPLHWDAKALLRLIINAALFWGLITLVIRIDKGDMDSWSRPMVCLAPMRAFGTFGLLSLGIGLLLKPTIGNIAFGIGIGVFMLSIIMGLVMMYLLYDKKAPPDQCVPDNDPIRQNQFWKCGDLFYFNQKDYRLFVPRRNSKNEYALNIALARVWVILFAIGVIPLLPSLVKMLLP